MRFAPHRGTARRLIAAAERFVLGDALIRARMAMACAVSLLGLAPAVVSAQATNAVVRLSAADYRSYLPENHSVREALRQFAEDAGRKSQGQLQIDVLHGTVTGSPAQQIETFRQGLLDTPQIMLLAATGVADLNKDFEWFDLPYAVRDEAAVEAIVNGAQGQRMLAGLTSQGMVGLAWMSNGFRQITTSSVLINSPEDLRGISVRTLAARASITAFKAWGAQPVAIPAAQVRDALREGRVEAQEGFISQVLQSRLYEEQKHLWLTNHSYGAQVLVVNLRTWNLLSDEQKTWLVEAAQDAARRQRARARQEDLLALNSLKHLGLQVHQLAPEITEALMGSTKDLRVSVHGGKDAAGNELPCATSFACHQPAVSGAQALVR